MIEKEVEIEIKQEEAAGSEDPEAEEEAEEASEVAVVEDKVATDFLVIKKQQLNN